MKPYQERVVQELRELCERRDRLDAFIHNPVFLSLPKDEQDRMQKQFAIMRQYEFVLEDRIAHFPA